MNRESQWRSRYRDTFLDSVPGLDASWIMLGILEAIAFLLFAASLVSGEFLPRRRKSLLLTGRGVSIFTFGVMRLPTTVPCDDGLIPRRQTLAAVRVAVIDRGRRSRDGAAGATADLVRERADGGPGAAADECCRCGARRSA